jgi:hypothetical protein
MQVVKRQDQGKKAKDHVPERLMHVLSAEVPVCPSLERPK